MGDETQELTQRAVELVACWNDSVFGLEHGRLKAEGARLLDEIGECAACEPGECEPLIALLSLPPRSAAAGLVERTCAELTSAGSAAVLPLLRVALGEDKTSADRALAVLADLPADDLVRGALAVFRSADHGDLRETAFNELAKRGDPAADALEALSDDRELGPLAVRCREKLDGFPPQWEAVTDLPLQIGELGYVYLDAHTLEDAAYALEALAALLEQNEGRLDEAANHELDKLVAGLVDAWFEADDDEEAAAVDRLAYLVEECGRWFDEETLDLVREVEVTPETEALLDLVEDHAAAQKADARPPVDGPRHPLLERLQEEQIDFSLAPGWTTPEGIEPDGPFGRLLEILANDAVDELKDEVVESLVGEPGAIAELRVLKSHPKAGKWVGEVLRRDHELAGADGLTLERWAAQGPATLVDDLVEAHEDDDEARDADDEGGAGRSADEPVAEAAVDVGELPVAGAPNGEPPSGDEMERDFAAFERRMRNEMDA